MVLRLTWLFCWRRWSIPALPIAAGLGGTAAPTAVAGALVTAVTAPLSDVVHLRPGTGLLPYSAAEIFNHPDTARNWVRGTMHFLYGHSGSSNNTSQTVDTAVNNTRTDNNRTESFGSGSLPPTSSAEYDRTKPSAPTSVPTTTPTTAPTLPRPVVQHGNPDQQGEGGLGYHLADHGDSARNRDRYYPHCMRILLRSCPMRGPGCLECASRN